MADTKLELDLDPKQVLDSMQVLTKATQELAEKVEIALGKEAVKNFKKLEDQAQESADKVSSTWRQLGNRLKEDMKNFLGLNALMEGMKMGNSMREGAVQVFAMEKAFDKLNTRLGLSVDKLNEFKKNVVGRIAGTGQSLEAVMPGMERVAERGGVKNPNQLADIAETLGRAKGITGEGTEALAESVVSILQNQQQKVTASSFKKTLDALEAGRVHGGMGTATEVGSAVAEMSKTSKYSHLNIRELSAMAGVAARGGEGSLGIMKHLVESAQNPGQQDALNKMLGVQLFKNGKMDSTQLGKVDTGRMGQYSEQVLGGAVGGSGADLKRLVDAFKENSADFQSVVNGTDETATQFGVASDNMATKIDKFKENLKGTVMVVGDDLSRAANDFLKGDFKGGIKSVGAAGGALADNAGTTVAGIGTVVAGALLASGGLRQVMSNMPSGLGGIASGMATGQLAKMAGATPVYVVNASEIGGGGGSAASGALGFLGGMGKSVLGAGKGLLANAAILGGTAITDIGAMGAGAMGAAGLGVGAAGLAGYGIGMGINKLTGNEGQLGEKLYDFLHPEQMTKAIETGMSRAQGKKPVQVTNPSKPKTRY